MKTIAFFNNKGGVGKTTLTYHLAWMFHHLGLRVVVADLDPQANLTAAFLTNERLEALWAATPPKTIFGALEPLNDRLGDIREPHVEDIDGIGLLVGDLSLSGFEDRLAVTWPLCLDDNRASAQDAFRVTSAFSRIIERAARERSADVVLLDVGPNLGALNRAALVAADYVVVPLAADLFSLRGLRNLGPALREWRAGWTNRRERPDGDDAAHRLRRSAARCKEGERACARIPPMDRSFPRDVPPRAPRRRCARRAGPRVSRARAPLPQPAPALARSTQARLRSQGSRRRDRQPRVDREGRVPGVRSPREGNRKTFWHRDPVGAPTHQP